MDESSCKARSAASRASGLTGARRAGTVERLTRLVDEQSSEAGDGTIEEGIPTPTRAYPEPSGLDLALARETPRERALDLPEDVDGKPTALLERLTVLENRFGQMSSIGSSSDRDEIALAVAPYRRGRRDSWC
jgi:hypothetical protein